MQATYRRTVTVTVTEKTDSAFNKIVLPPQADETARQRHDRLAEQGSINHARVRNLDNGKFSVQSQCQDSEGHRPQAYIVLWTGNGWFCECAFGSHQPGVECVHTSRVIEYVKRNKLPFGSREAVRAARSASEAVTDAWIARARESRKARGRTELAEEI